jgi:pectate lyase
VDGADSCPGDPHSETKSHHTTWGEEILRACPLPSGLLVSTTPVDGASAFPYTVDVLSIGLRPRLLAGGIAAALVLAAMPATALANRSDLGRQVLPAGDGWGSYGAGTTGGAAADRAHVYTVHNRAELVAALGDVTNSTPKIIKVRGTIDANVDEAGAPQGCDDYAAGTGYSLPAFLAAYDPATWGRVAPSGPLEDARRQAAANQSARVAIRVPSNTTIIGEGRNPTIDGASLRLNGEKAGRASNIIIRNLTLRNTYDCFPSWDPTDGELGNWNAAHDTIQIINGAENIWIDHNTFTDFPNFDRDAPILFGRLYQRHDGASDITNASDFITVSWNRYTDHDKTMLIGSTNNATHDDGNHLRVTIHHNEFRDVGQRVPRLRWGKNDVYNNYYVISRPDEYSYSLGVGVFSHIYAEKNYFRIAEDLPAAEIISEFDGTELFATGNLVNGRPADLLEIYNAANDPDLLPDTSWTPTLRKRVDPAWAVPSLTRAWAGAGKIG